MKKHKLLSKFTYALLIPAFLLACDDDDNGAGPASVDFASIASTAMEASDNSITIPLRGSNSGLDIVFGGTATEGVDYELGGISAEGVTVNILDDNEFEFDETIVVRLVSSSANLNGNAEHVITLLSECTDLSNFVETGWFVREFDAVEDDGVAPYGPYHLAFEPDETDPNKFWTDNFWDSGLPAYIVYDPATNTVSFPTQTPLANFPTRIITSTPAPVNQCDRTFTITTSYRGLTWEYIFVRPQTETLF